MRRYAFFRDAVHLLGADLHLELVAAVPHHRGVQGLVSVGPRNGDEVLDAARNRPPQSVNEAEHRVTGGHILGDNPDGQEVVNAIEGALGPLDLLVDGKQPLDSPLHPRLDVVFPELLRQHVFHAAQKLLALLPPRLHTFRNALVAHRIGVAEGQVFKLAAHLAHAQPMRQRCVDVHGFPRDHVLPIRPQVLQRAHVVQPVSQLDQHHAHIRDHGQQHLAHVLRLPVLAVGKLDLVDLGDAFDDVRHLLAKFRADLRAGRRRVLHGVVQQCRRNGGRVQLHLRQNLGDFQGMDDVGFAGGAHLAGVVKGAKLPGAADQGNVFIWAI